MTPEPITLTSAAWQKMIDHCQEAYPLEACGFLFGTGAQQDGLSARSPAIDEFIPIANIAADAGHRFRMDPQQVVQALARRPETPRALLGIVHSHPKAPPIPSMRDLDPLWSSVASYWIVSLSDPLSPSVRAYRFKSGGETALQAVPLVIRIRGSDL